MQIYAKEDEKYNYIVDYKPIDDERIRLEFADKRVYRDLANTKENIEHLNEQMEEQVLSALPNIRSYKSKAFISNVGAVLCTTGATCFAGYVTALAGLPDDVRYCLTGAALLTSAIPFTINAYKNNAKYRELSKIKYRENHRDKLESIDDYNHALDGIGLKLRDHIEKNPMPFGVNYSSLYSQKDLESIITEMTREDVQIKDRGLTLIKK